MRNLLLLFCCCCLFVACQQTVPQKDITVLHNVSKIDTISYELKSISQKYGDCEQVGERCAKADMQYVVINAPKMTAAFEKINKTLENTVKGNAPTVQAAIDSFIAEATTFYEAFPDVPQGYGMELAQKVILDTLGIFTIEEFSYTYTGGAHGNYGTSFYNFDRNTGRILRLADLLIADHKATLKALAEPIFREKYLEAGMTQYSEAGFYFENDTFTLTDNVAITQKGLKFVYNPYEIGPYAMGQQAIVIPYASLKDLVKEHGVLEQF
ncbi:MAG: DUF3298 domain-containing protein [Bacteroidota bacterium]